MNIKNYIARARSSIKESLTHMSVVSALALFLVALKFAGVPLPLSYFQFVMIIFWPITVLFGLAVLVSVAFCILAGVESAFKKMFGELWYQRLHGIKARVRKFLQDMLENISDIFEP